MACPLLGRIAAGAGNEERVCGILLESDKRAIKAAININMHPTAARGSPMVMTRRTRTNIIYSISTATDVRERGALAQVTLRLARMTWHGDLVVPS